MTGFYFKISEESEGSFFVRLYFCIYSDLKEATNSLVGKPLTFDSVYEAVKPVWNTYCFPVVDIEYKEVFCRLKPGVDMI